MGGRGVKGGSERGRKRGMVWVEVGVEVGVEDEYWGKESTPVWASVFWQRMKGGVHVPLSHKESSCPPPLGLSETGLPAEAAQSTTLPTIPGGLSAGPHAFIWLHICVVRV